MSDIATLELLYVPPAPKPPEREVASVAPFKWLSNAIEAWPDAVYEQAFYKPPWPGTPLLVCDPKAVRAILLDQAESFPRHEVIRRIFSAVWGKGVFTAEGRAWRWQRHAAAPAFRPDRVLAMVPAMTAAAEAALNRWRAAGAGGRLDLFAEMKRTTFDVILETALSGGEDFGDLDEANRQITAFLDDVGRLRPMDFLPWPEALRGSPDNRGGGATRYLRRHIGAMVARRRATPSRKGDLVDLLLCASDPETGEAMDDVVLRDNLIGFIAAGHDTTATALTWSLYLAFAHAPTQARLVEEIRAVAGDAPIGPEHIERLVFTKQVLQEAMRLYPPAALVVTRAPSRDIEVDGHRIRKGEMVSVPIYALHRHRAYWTNPDAFDPDRFAPEIGLDKQRFLYMPFGAGPRICMGATFAMIEMTAVLATLVRAVRLEHDPSHRIRPLVRSTLRPEGGMPMTVQFRG